MADVTGLTGRRSTGASGDDRGQLVLVAAISVAVLFVAFASVLNAATFAEATATEGADADLAVEAASFQQAAADNLEATIVSANEHNNTNRSALDSALTAAVADWDNMSGTHAAVNGRSASVTLDPNDIEDGRLLAQNVTRNLTSTNGDVNWTLASGVGATRIASVTVSDASSLATQGSTSKFTVSVKSGAWTAEVFRQGANIKVSVNDTSGITTTCTTSGSSSTIDFVAGTLGDTDCAALQFGDDVSGTYDVAFANADAIEGSFAFVVDKASLGGGVAANYGTEASGPYEAPAIFAATIDVVYESPQSTYDASVRVEPEDEN